MSDGGWSIKDEIMLRIYTLVYGRSGFYKYVAKRLLHILRREKVPIRKYVMYFTYMCTVFEEALIKEIDKLLNKKEKEGLEKLAKELESEYIW